MLKGTTITAGVYCGTQMRLQKAIKLKTPGPLMHGINLLHDNASPHSTNITQSLLKSFKGTIFHHPLPSPDLAPSDYQLFKNLKMFL